MLGKVKDAWSMLWLSLDSNERQYFVYILLYAGATFASIYLRATRIERERREAERMQLMAALIAKQMRSPGAPVA